MSRTTSTNGRVRQMSGVCGWIDRRHDTKDARHTVERMRGHLIGEDVARNGSIVLTQASAVSTQSGIVSIDIHQRGPLTVAVQGQIGWAAPELAKISADRGCAASLVEAYRRHGVDCLQFMSGPFAVAVIDDESSGGLLAIDRMGIRSLCYANPPGALVFGTTAESVAAHPSVGRKVSRQAIFNYLYFHVVPSPGTIFDGVHKLLPGECITFRDGVLERSFYWRLPYREQAARSPVELEARFKELLRDATARAIDGDTRVGAFLSGGTDSSTVTGLLTELRGKPAKTYSIGFSADGFDEMKYARITAQHFATSAHERYLTPSDVVDAIPIIARAYDEPFGNESAVPTYLCAKMAFADGVEVLLAGDGGDEIFGGNVRYARQKIFEAYWLLPAPLRRHLLEPLASVVPTAVAPLRKFRSYVLQASIPLPDRLESYNFLHRSPLSEIFEPDFLASVDSEQPAAMLREVYQRTASASSVNRMMHVDLKFTLADNDLRKVSRMCEAAGIEVRYPLLDDALVEFSGEIPPSLKVKGLELRYFFKHALRDYLPPATLTKTKHGFGMPFGLWLREHKPLADLVHRSLDGFSQRGIVKPGYLTDLLRQHETDHATYYGAMIWVIMMLERWLSARGL